MTLTAAFSPGDYAASAVRAVSTAPLLSSSATAARDGVIQAYAAPFLVTSAGAMDLSVAPGKAVVAGWVVVSDAVEPVTVSPATTAARTDLVVLRVYDTESGDATSKAAIEMVTGTSVSVPATPARSIVLAQIAVGASVSSITSANITDKRVLTAGAGGLLALPNRLATVPGAEFPDGQGVWDSAAKDVGFSNAGAWSRLMGKTTYLSATINGATLGAGGGTLGYANSINITAVPYQRIGFLWVSGYVSSNPTNGAVSIHIRDSTAVVIASTTVIAQGVSLGVMMPIRVSANQATSFAPVVSASVACSVTSDSRWSKWFCLLMPEAV